ncbi:hypothetical protein WJX72_011917 [[Myrmecia] bisecta]|uniref:Uncharacterized protein n=1 Tax=[Myrmecia] bisecta TaxID=41462 RepID=A0AAW1Q4Z6_9CHLO
MRSRPMRPALPRQKRCLSRLLALSLQGVSDIRARVHHPQHSSLLPAERGHLAELLDAALASLRSGMHSEACSDSDSDDRLSIDGSQASSSKSEDESDGRLSVDAEITDSKLFLEGQALADPAWPQGHAKRRLHLDLVAVVLYMSRQACL